MKWLGLIILAAAYFCPVHTSANPQSASKRTDDDGRSPLALIAARAEYIYRLEKLLALQESDLQTNEGYLNENGPLLEQNKSLVPYLTAIEALIQNTKELIKCTRELLAKAEL